MARSITFTVDGDVGTETTISETETGALVFTITQTDGRTVGDLGALFFDLTDPATGEALDLSTLDVSATADHDDVTAARFGEAAVSNLGQGQNVNGKVINDLGRFDAGVRFGAPGIGKDDIRETSFVLSSADGPLSLDMLSLSDIALRYTSVGAEGGERTDSLKLAGQTGAVARNDELSVDENDAGSVNLLVNDDLGATRTVTAVEDDDGACAAGPAGFTREVVVDGRVLGTMTIEPDGTMDFTADGADVDALALGEIAEYEFTYTSSGDGTLATACVTLLIVGTNDAPDITVEAGDSAVVVLPETDCPLTAEGFLTLTDPDVSDVVGVAVVSVDAAGDDHAAPPATELVGMLMLAPATVLQDGDTQNRFLWSFDSGARTFDYLAVGESLRLDYLVRASDDSGAGNATDDQVVRVTITGTNDAPDILVEAGDSDAAEVMETGDPLAVDGTLSLTDLDQSDTVTVEVTALTVSGDLTDPEAPTQDQLHAMLTVDPVQVLDATGTRGGFAWSFVSGAETFAYLITDEELVLSYRITADDGRGLSNSTDVQTVTVTIIGTNERPDISVETGDRATATTTENDAGVVLSGTLTVTDNDLADTVALSIVGFTADGANPDQPDDADLEAMLSIAPLDILDTTETRDRATWTFNSDGQSFAYLRTGESLVLSYVIRATDDSGSTDATDEQTITITITGRNEAPDISVQTGNSAYAEVTETDAALTAMGTLTVGDRDTLDEVVAEVVSVIPLGATSDPRTPDYATLLSMMAVRPTQVLDATETSASLTWEFESAPNLLVTTFDYLEPGERLSLVYEVRATDSAGLTDTQLLRIDIVGTNDVPNITGTPPVRLLTETDEGQVTSGNYTVLDADSLDLLYADFSGMNLSGTTGGTGAPTPTELREMLTIDLATDTGLPFGRLNWAFDSGDEAFDYLAVGEALGIGYTLQVTDGVGVPLDPNDPDSIGDVDTAGISITIQGTNDAPEIVVEPGDRVATTFFKNDLPFNAQTSSELTLRDLDSSDEVVVSYDMAASTVMYSSTDVASRFANVDFLGNFSLAEATLASGETEQRFLWEYDARGEIFPGLALDETIELTLKLLATDLQGATDTQDIAITFSGEINAAPRMDALGGARVLVLDEDENKPSHGPAGPADYTLTKTGQIALKDADIDDSVDVTVAGVTTRGETDGLPDDATLIGLLGLPPLPTLGTTETNAIFDWTFTAENTLFDYLQPGERVSILYDLLATDSRGAEGALTVEVQVFNDNKFPDIRQAAGDILPPAIFDAGSANISTEGTLTIYEYDQFDSVFATVEVDTFQKEIQTAPDDATLLSWFSVANSGDPSLDYIVKSGELSGRLKWTFSATNSEDVLEALGLGEDIRIDYSVVADDGEGGTDTFIVPITLRGIDDPVTFSGTGAITLDEADAGISGTTTTTVTDPDLVDRVNISIDSVAVSGNFTSVNDDGDDMLPTLGALLGMLTLDADDLVLAYGEASKELNWTFASGRETFDFLREGESLILEYGVSATSFLTNDSDTITVTINGTNDSPVAEDVEVFAPISGSAITGQLLGSDEDMGDSLSYRIVDGVATDSEDSATYAVTVDANGVFSLTPTGALLDLEPGEVRTLTFDYVAVDDSGAGVGVPGVESEESLPATGTVTVWGAYGETDAKTTRLVFETEGQSQHYSGEPSDAQDDAAFERITLDFFGFDQSVSFNQKFGGQKFQNGAVTSIVEGIGSVIEALANIGCEIGTLGFGDCDVDLDIPSSVTLTRVEVDIDIDARVGVEPFFELASGEMGARVPVDVVFTKPENVTLGEAFVIETGYVLNPGTSKSSFVTSPTDLIFGLDMVFDLSADATVDIESGKLGKKTKGPSKELTLFDLDTGEQRINLLTVTSDEDPLVTSDALPFKFNGATEEQINDTLSNAPNVSAVLNLPKDDLEVEGNVGNGLSGGTETEFISVIVDMDQIISSATGVPLEAAVTIPKVEFDALPGESGGKVKLMSGSVALEVFEAELIAAYSLVQDFEMDVRDLPILVTFEDGTAINARLGEAIIVGPDDLNPDFDYGDGRLDYTVDVDMDAIFDSLATIGFDMELFFGILKGQIKINSDFLPKIDISLFDTDSYKDSDGNEIPSSDGYAVGNVIQLIDDDNGPEAYRNREFEIEGWEETTGLDPISDSILFL